MIIFKKEISDYYTQPFADMYNDLLAIRKDEYSNERIIITAFGETTAGIWKHFFRIINTIDIPTFFIKIVTNQTLTHLIIKEQEYILQDNPIDIETVHAPLILDKVNEKFDIPDSMCINPFTNLEINVKGDITVCCEIDRKGFSKDFPKAVNIKDISNVAEAKNSEHVKRIQQDFLQGKMESYCNACWKQEAVGVTSKRQRDQYFYKDLQFTTDFYNEKKIRSLDLKLGITCNLKCRICSYASSSAWYSEQKRYEDVPLLEELDYGYTLSRKMWTEAVQELHDLKYISYAGGEPFLDRTHLAKLEFLLQQNRNDIHIHYNTNGTQYSQQHIDVLNEFDNVSLTFSIDNVGDKFEYERHGSTWSIVQSKLEQFSKLDRSRYRLEFYPTVSIFNILDLDNIIDYCEDLGFTYTFNILHYPKYFSLYNIPMSARSSIIDKLMSSKRKEIRAIAGKYKEETYYNLHNEFWDTVNIIDLRRKENFKTLYTDMSAIMQESS